VRVTQSPLDVAHLRTRVQSALTAFLTRQRTRLAEIDEASLLPVADAIEAFVAGGKRLRPAFAYWGYRGAAGPDSDAVIAAAGSLEFVQASALMHDDVMDGSETRRGEPAVHRRFAALHARSGWLGGSDRFGTCAAILLGDLCLVWSDEMLSGSGLPIDVLARARPVFDEMRTQVTVGQYLDVHTQATGDSSTERASLVARYKSAKYTIEQPLLFGAAIAGAPAGLGKVYSAYGMPLGEAFQLRDDVLGVFGDPAVTGKPAGDDLREGKRTYLVAAALEAADPAGRLLITRLLGDPQLDGDGVAALREVITASGALARTERRIDVLTATALEVIEDPEVAPDAAKVLRSLAELAAHRHG
jgi:geranylgeranyl diphosphate synthase, type I